MFRSDFEDGSDDDRFHGDMRHGYDQAKYGSAKTLASLATIREDGGEYSWMGIKLDRDIALLLQDLTSGAPAFIAEKLNNGVYGTAVSVHERLAKQLPKVVNNSSAHKFGLHSAAAATALLIGLQPIMTIVQAAKERKNARNEVNSELKDIIDANKHYKDNEVVKTALEHTQKIFSAGLKNAASQLPSVLVNGYFAHGNHKILKENTTKIQDGQTLTPEDKKRTVEIDANTQKFMGTGAVIGNRLIHNNLFKDIDKDLKQISADKLILQLRKQIINGEIYKGTDLSDRIIEIFQQNEVDRGRHAIGPALMDKFTPLAKDIGDAISNRELDAISLVNLVGNKKVINNRKFITTEQLDDILEHEKNNFGSREKQTLEELLSNHQDPKRVMQAIKDNLQNLKGDEKAVFVALFSDDVLLKSGMKKKELRETRTRGHDVFCEFIKAKAVEISGKSPEELKAHNISEPEIQAVREFNELVSSGDKKAITSAIRSTGEDGTNQIKKAVLNYGLSDTNFSWSAAIKSAKKDIPKKEPATSMVEAVNKSKQNGNGASLNA